MGSLKWKKCLGSLKKSVFALFLTVPPKKDIKKGLKTTAKMALATDSCLERLVFFGGGTHPWLGGAHGCTPVANPTPQPRPRPLFCPLEPTAQTPTQCQWQGCLMRLYFSDFFYPSMTVNPTLYAATATRNVWWKWCCMVLLPDM